MAIVLLALFATGLALDLPNFAIPKFSGLFGPGRSHASTRKLLQAECTEPQDYSDPKVFLATLPSECQAVFNPVPTSTITCPTTNSSTSNLAVGGCCDNDAQCASGYCDPEWRTCTSRCTDDSECPPLSGQIGFGSCGVCGVCEAQQTCESSNFCATVCPTYVGNVNGELLNTSGCLVFNNQDSDFAPQWAKIRPACVSACTVPGYPYLWEAVFRGEYFGCSPDCTWKRLNDTLVNYPKLCYPDPNNSSRYCGDSLADFITAVATVSPSDPTFFSQICAAAESAGCCLFQASPTDSSLSALCSSLGFHVDPTPCAPDDCSNSTFGPVPPDGECVRGVCKDLVPFDGNWTCECSAVPGSGNLCQFVDCDLAPNCQANHRAACNPNLDAPNTCGPCEPTFWSNDDPLGFSNVPCTAGAACPRAPTTSGVGVYSSSCANALTGQTCTLGCPSGYDVPEGAEEAVCGDGVWQNTASCLPRCSSSPESPNGIGSYYCPLPATAGSSCNITCPAGYNGSAEALCTTNGTTGMWEVNGDGCFPTCSQPTLSGVQFEDCDGYGEGDYCYAACSSLQIPVSPLICLNGAWHLTQGVPGCLELCTSPPANNATAGIIFSASCNFGFPGQQCTFFTCAADQPFGYALCGADGQWDTTNATCLPQNDCSTAPLCFFNLFREDCDLSTPNNTCGVCSNGFESNVTGPSNVPCTPIVNDCSGAPNCTALHRWTCSFDTPSNTCGMCNSGLSTANGSGPGNTTCFDCSLAQNCGSLNRMACSSTTGANVCGACASGFMNPFGDSTLPGNTQCVSGNDCTAAPNCTALNRAACTGNSQCGACLNGYTGSANPSTQCTKIDLCASAPICSILNRKPCVSANTCEDCLPGFFADNSGPANTTCVAGTNCTSAPSSTGTNGATFPSSCNSAPSGSQCTPQCPSGLTNNGTTTLTCSNGVWTGTVYCASTCPQSPPPATGVTWGVCSTVSGATCTGTCSGSSNTTARARCSGGTWQIIEACVACGPTEYLNSTGGCSECSTNCSMCPNLSTCAACGFAPQLGLTAFFAFAVMVLARFIN